MTGQSSGIRKCKSPGTADGVGLFGHGTWMVEAGQDMQMDWGPKDGREGERSQERDDLQECTFEGHPATEPGSS